MSLSGSSDRDNHVNGGWQEPVAASAHSTVDRSLGDSGRTRWVKNPSMSTHNQPAAAYVLNSPEPSTSQTPHTQNQEAGYSRMNDVEQPAQYSAPAKRQSQRQTENLEAAEDPKCGVCEVLLTAISIFLIFITFPLTLWFCIKVVQEYERAVIFRLGRVLPGAKGPGLFFIIPCIENFVKTDLRTVSFDVPPQEILTKDSVTCAVDAVVYYKVSNPMISVCNVENFSTSTRLLAQTTLRNILGAKTLSEILSDRDHISSQMQEILDVGTDPWGVKVERVEIKDVRLPQQLQRAMATEAEAAREARAKVIAAEGEMKASRALKEAADVINEAPSALQLRYLQTLTQISAEKNSTIIFPLPIDMLKGFNTSKSASAKM